MAGAVPDFDVASLEAGSTPELVLKALKSCTNVKVRGSDFRLVA
jgi:hypothetical protein